LTAPATVPAPASSIAAHQYVTPGPGEPTRVESGAYALQPADGPPKRAYIPATSTAPPANVSQNDSGASAGTASVRAPAARGTSRLPRNPCSSGVAAKKTITAPCVVKSVAYSAGPMTPCVRG
jgi:hypothetical protein